MSDERFTNSDMLPVFLTARELNKRVLHISENRLYDLLRMPGCPKVKIGKKYLIPVEKFVEWLETGNVAV